jgi:hypothetical protein
LTSGTIGWKSPPPTPKISTLTSDNFHVRANPTAVSYNASAVKMCNATSSVVRFEFFFLLLWKSYLGFCRSQSYDLQIYNYNASFAVCRLERFFNLEEKINFQKAH